MMGWIPLHSASTYGHTECILLDAGADFNLKDNNGRTPLHSASWNDHANCVRILLDAGADLNLKDNLGRTPFELANDETKAFINEWLKNNEDPDEPESS
jgi:ankyrin repeat protein